LRKFINRVEKYLIRLITLSLIAVVVSQGLMTNEPFRLYLSWGERLEGQLFEYPAIAENPNQTPPAKVVSPDAVLTIAIEQYSALPKSIILVKQFTGGGQHQWFFIPFYSYSTANTTY
jgi:hypothetical protein